MPTTFFIFNGIVLKPTSRWTFQRPSRRLLLSALLGVAGLVGVNAAALLMFSPSAGADVQNAYDYFAKGSGSGFVRQCPFPEFLAETKPPSRSPTPNCQSGIILSDQPVDLVQRRDKWTEHNTPTVKLSEIDAVETSDFATRRRTRETTL